MFPSFPSQKQTNNNKKQQKNKKHPRVSERIQTPSRFPWSLAEAVSIPLAWIFTIYLFASPFIKEENGGCFQSLGAHCGIPKGLSSGAFFPGWFLAMWDPLGAHLCVLKGNVLNIKSGIWRLWVCCTEECCYSNFNKTFILIEITLIKLKWISTTGGKRDRFFANYFSSKILQRFKKKRGGEKKNQPTPFIYLWINKGKREISS